MKTAVITLCLCLTTVAASGQGIVVLANNSSTLVSVSSFPWDIPIPMTGAGGFFFGLFTAPVGTTDPHQFVFSGLYGTNNAAAGRFHGGQLNGVAVPGWAPGESRSFQVRGWPSWAGHDWNEAWLTDPFNSPIGFGYGMSTIGTGVAGGFDGIGMLPALHLFGPSPAITTGFCVIPEPTTPALLLLLTALTVDKQRRQKKWRDPAQEADMPMAQPCC